VRSNIIPDEVRMMGTLRTFDPRMRADLHERIRRTATLIAQGAGATADVVIDPGYPVTFNDPNLAGRLAPVLQMVAGKGHVAQAPVVTGAEDFSCYQRQIPGLYFFLGVTPEGTDLDTTPMCHSPHFCADEGALVVGVRTLAHLAVAGLQGQK
jgi:metal-dependent amidase/aminoacylase/carboxypeptidase family protein